MSLVLQKYFLNQFYNALSEKHKFSLFFKNIFYQFYNSLLEEKLKFHYFTKKYIKKYAH